MSEPTNPFGMPPEPAGLEAAAMFMEATEDFANLAAVLGGYRAQLMGQGFGPEVADRLVADIMEQAFLEQRRDWVKEAAGSDPHRLSTFLDRWLR